jgi:hypothetical protein
MSAAQLTKVLDDAGAEYELRPTAYGARGRGAAAPG